MIKISVCIGSACHLKGSYNVINGIQQAIEKNGLSDKGSYKWNILHW
ncbi:MAG: (2Fe-2S) ferredoxin domain-containing protein [Lachnospirales bacterium]